MLRGGARLANLVKKPTHNGPSVGNGVPTLLYFIDPEIDPWTYRSAVAFPTRSGLTIVGQSTFNE